MQESDEMEQERASESEWEPNESDLSADESVQTILKRLTAEERRTSNRATKKKQQEKSIKESQKASQTEEDLREKQDSSKSKDKKADQKQKPSSQRNIAEGNSRKRKARTVQFSTTEEESDQETTGSNSETDSSQNQESKKRKHNKSAWREKNSGSDNDSSSSEKVAKKKEPKRERKRNKQEDVQLSDSDTDDNRRSKKKRSMTTWDMLLPLWPLEERPDEWLNRKYVNATKLADALVVKTHWELKLSKEGKGRAQFGKDSKIPTKEYKAEKDNCSTRLHKVRFERGPVVEHEKYWERMPVKRRHTYRHLAMNHEGGEGQVNENVILRAHDRTMPLKLRMFLRTNFTKKGFSADSNKEAGAEWEAPKTLLALQEALINMQAVMAKLWPLDDTTRIIHRTIVNYNYGAGVVNTEKEKIRLLEEFGDNVLRDNSNRAATDKEYLSYKGAKEVWRETVENWESRETRSREQDGHRKFEHKADRRLDGISVQLKQDNKSFSNNLQSAGPSRVGSQQQRGARRPDVMYKGSQVCYHFNNKFTTCTRTQKANGCEDKQGKFYAHVCNYETTPGTWCLKDHARCDNH